MEEEYTLDEDLAIDPDALDVECLRQATLFYRYSKAENLAKKHRDEIWEKSKVIRSQLLLEAAEDKAVKNALQQEAYYRNDLRHQEIKKQLADAEYEVNMAQTAVWAFRQRKDMLENLIRLGLADYFARPTQPRNLSAEAGSGRDLRREEKEKTPERIHRRRRT